jgi:hypothetical protein
MTANQDQKKQPKLERLQFSVPKDGSIDDMVDAIMSQLPRVNKNESKESPKPKD